MLLVLTLLMFSAIVYALDFEVVDTGQTKSFDSLTEIATPAMGDSYYGQDAQCEGNQPNYTDNGDYTVTDNVTGLMWSQTCDTNGDGNIDVDDKMSFEDAINNVGDVNIGGYDDWRVPTLKEQYSLIVFTGIDPSGFDGSVDDLIPFIDTDYFDFGYGDEAAGERIIDAQMITTTLYTASNDMMFGVNFADGRIKGYGTGPMPGQTEDKQFYVYYVRGNTEYGTNDFAVNGDATISDNATGLMWTQDDNGEGLNWESALAWAQQKNDENYLGYSDWRLPNVKELQSIVDYSRSPNTTSSAAIDAVFNCTEITNVGGETDYSYYWSGTTHENWSDVNGGFASYVSFGRALGWMEEPPMSGHYTLMDVHGAGAQRSDPKDGDPDEYPNGNGPQGDVVRIFNYVRLVRDFEPDTATEESLLGEDIPNSIKLTNYPNPFNPQTTISFELDPEYDGSAVIAIYDLRGKKVKAFDHLENKSSVVWDGSNEQNRPVASGVYLYTINYNGNTISNKMMLLK